MWVKKVENAEDHTHLDAVTFSDVNRYIEEAFKFDHNLIIEEYP